MKKFCSQKHPYDSKYTTNIIRAFVLFSFLVINPIFVSAGQEIEGKFNCSIELNRFTAMKDGQLIEAPLSNLKNNQIFINYVLSPVSVMDSAWAFFLELEAEEFERTLIIMIAKSNIPQPFLLKMDRELMVRDNENDRSRLDLSEDLIKFVGGNQIVTMRRYYKSDWDVLSIEFNAKETVFTHTLGLNCRNETDRIDQIIDIILESYE